jgi:type II secretion system (T2SS) protein G
MVLNKKMIGMVMVLVMPVSCVSFLSDKAFESEATLADGIPPESVTENRLSYTYVRIQNFWNQNGRVPKEPSELPDVEDHDCEMNDGWGHQFHWDSDGVSKVTVWSLGRDGKPGGVGEDTDLEVVFVGKEKIQEHFPHIGRRVAR